MSLFPLGLISQGGGAGGGAAFELISTQTSSGASTSFTFNSLPATYAHLQLRITANANLATRYHMITFNGSATGYNNHSLYGNGTTVTSDYNTPASPTSITTLNDVPSTTNQFGATIVDILDYNTNKTKTVRKFFGGVSAANIISLASGLWNNTAAITSVTVTCSGGGTYTSGTRVSLYGVRGS